MSDTTHTPEIKFTAEDVSKLVQSKIDEYVRLAKVVLWIVIGSLTLLIGVLNIPAVKYAVLASFIKVEQLFDDQGRVFLQDQIKNYLSTNEKGKDFLQTEIRIFLANDTQARSVLRNQIEAYLLNEIPAQFAADGPDTPLKARAKQTIQDQVSANLKSEVRNIVSKYSFSTSFQLSDEDRSHTVRFFKPNGSSAEIECGAAYQYLPKKTAKDRPKEVERTEWRKSVYVTLNEDDSPSPFFWVNPLPGHGPDGRTQRNRGEGKKKMSSDNKQYFPQGKKVSDYHNMVFQVDESSSALQGKIFLDCTVTVTVAAEFAQRQ
jgi:hypothetical protein